MISIEELTAPLPGNDPCGEDLAAGTSLIELDALILGKSETAFRQAEAPDWRKVRQTCLDLFGRSRDLRVSVALCLALLCTDGVGGLREGLTVLRTLLQKFWVPLHPKLDPEDANDPLQRMNTIAVLAAPVGKDGDPFRFVERLLAVPLTNSRQIGRFTFGAISDARKASTKQAPVAAGGIDPTQIDGAFRDTAAEELRLTYQDCGQALEQLRAIDGFLRTTVGAVHAPNLSEMEKTLSGIRDTVGPYVQTVASTPGEASAIGAGAQTVVRSNSSEVSSRDDVLRVLKQVRSFYTKHEPASPIPLFIHRIERMVPMTFLELMTEMAPDAIKQVNIIVGPQAK
jgi:type VI secretion system protein ImpA